MSIEPRFASTDFTDDEMAFRQAVREFAESEIKPKVHKMDAEQQMDPDIVKQLFEMGIMGIETPESYGGSGGSFTMACVAVEEIARIDGSVSVLLDVQNTLVTNALLKSGSPTIKEKYLPRLAKEWVGAYALSESVSEIGRAHV